MVDAVKSGGAVKVVTVKRGANFMDRNRIAKMHEAGHSLEEISGATKIAPDVVKTFLPKKKATKKKATKKVEAEQTEDWEG